MSEVYINKLAAAQRQFNAAVRIYFSQEEELAAFTVAHAALGICEDIFEKRHPGVIFRETRGVVEEGIRSLIKNEGVSVPKNWHLKDPDKKLLAFYKKNRNKHANFLKHANSDPSVLLKKSEVDVDVPLLSTSAYLLRLNIEPSPEQNAFGRWHLAVYPVESGDELLTSAVDNGRRLFIHELEKPEQKEAGQLLLELFCESC